MTEEEAHKKWCPFVRIVNGTISGSTSEHNAGQVSYNRVVEESKWAAPVGGCCIASACMAWRPTDNQIWHSQNDPHPTSPPIPAGYCGLAGTPQ